MKTTIDIANALLDDAKALARRRGMTLRGVVEEGLRLVLADADRRVEPYTYEPVIIDLKPIPGLDLDDPAVLKDQYRSRR